MEHSGGIPGEVERAVGVADDVPESSQHDRRRGKSRSRCRAVNSEIVLDPEEPGALRANAGRRVDRQAPVPERVHDVIVAIAAPLAGDLEIHVDATARDCEAENLSV
jgi:hypothetical protein